MIPRVHIGSFGRTDRILYYLAALAWPLLFVFASSANAQNTTPVMTLLNGGLQFGSNITRAVTIRYTRSSAAEFEIQFTNYVDATGSVTFILPNFLTDGYGDQLPISFGRNSAGYEVDPPRPNVNNATSFDPNNGTVNATVQSGVHDDYFWIGGTVRLQLNYVPAAYTGTIIAVIAITVGGQEYSSSLDIPVSATLQGYVSLSASGVLDFGQIISGTTPQALSAMAGNAPEFVANGVRNNRSTVTYSTNMSLNDGYGHTLTFTPSVYGSSSNIQTGSQPIASGSSLDTGGTNNRNYYFWLGGSLDPVPQGQTPGKYAAAFVLTVNY